MRQRAPWGALGATQKIKLPIGKELPWPLQRTLLEGASMRHAPCTSEKVQKANIGQAISKLPHDLDLFEPNGLSSTIR